MIGGEEEQRESVPANFGLGNFVAFSPSGPSSPCPVLRTPSLPHLAHQLEECLHSFDSAECGEFAGLIFELFYLDLLPIPPDYQSRYPGWSALTECQLTRRIAQCIGNRRIIHHHLGNE